MRVASAVLFIVTVMPMAASAQTLGDVARQEAERRKTLPPEEGKVYTNKDLRPAPAPTPKPADAPAPAAGGAASAPAGSAQAGTAAAKEPAASNTATPPADASKGEEYWRGRLKDLQTTLGRNETYVAAMQSQINGLTTEFVNRDDPAQREVIDADRKRALAELDRLKKEIDANRKAISDLQDEARRARVPPGWLR